LIGDGFDDVLAAARRGDEWAWTTVYRDLAPVLLGWLRSQRAPVPEDLVSEVLLQVVRDLSQFAGGESSFRSWVFTIARNRTIDQRRHDQRHPSVCFEDDDLVRLGEAGDDASLHAVEGVTTDELVELLAGLTEAEREVLTLRYVAGLSQRECAEVLAKTLNNVKQIQKRGLRSLRAHAAGLAYPFAGDTTLSET